MSVPDSILALHSYESLYEPTYQKLIKRSQRCNFMHAALYLLYDAIDLI